MIADALFQMKTAHKIFLKKLKKFKKNSLQIEKHVLLYMSVKFWGIAKR